MYENSMEIFYFLIVIFLKKMLLYKKEAKYPVLDKVGKNTC